MWKFLQKLGIFFIAFLVIFSSVSFTVERHLCAGQLYSESFFGHAKECGMADMDVSICKTAYNNQSVSKKSCCKTDLQFINGLQFKKESLIDAVSNQQLTANVNLIEYHFFLNKEIISTIFNNYFPPPIIKNLNILFGILRI